MPKFSVRKPLTVFVVVLAIIILGVVAYLKMTPDLLPNMDLPYVVIITADPGASPEKVENDVTKPMEQSMATLDEIKNVTSTSQDSVSMIMLEFEDGANMDTTSVDIQQKISVLQGEWDDTVGTPYVLKINPSMLPVMVTGISYEGKNVQEISDFVNDTLEDRLSGVTGVAQVAVSGKVEKQAHVMLSREKLEKLSDKLQGFIESEINESRDELLEAKKKVDDAQKQMDEAMSSVGDSMLSGVGDSIKDVMKSGVDTIQDMLEGDFSTAEETITGLIEGQTGLSDQLADGVSSAISGISQAAAGSVQLQNAKSQIETGLEAIDEARKQAGEQSDLSGKLTMDTIAALLTAQDFYMPAGYVVDNEGISYMVSVGDNITDRESLENLVLMDLGMDGMDPICLGDVADVIITDNSADIYAKLNGEDSVIATFTKQSNYATAEVSENLQERFTALEKEYEGLHFASLMDQGDYIRLIVSTIISSLLWGALFSVVVLYIFLRDWRPTVVTLVSIPVSLVFAVVLMYFSGVTINMISLSGLSVSVGMLVDNSVVVIENIYRLRAKGATVIQAAVSGAKQVAAAVTSSTLTTVCVFAPIVFVEGLTRTLFTDLALTMTYALMASLLVSLTLVPAMASGLLRREYTPKPGLLDRIYPIYRKAAAWSLSHKAVVLLLSLVLLVGSGFGLVKRGFTFMPEIDMPMTTVTITMPEECTMEQAAEQADRVMAQALTLENVETIGASMTSDSEMSFMSSGGKYDVTMYMTFPDGVSGIAAGKKLEALCADLDCEVTSAGPMDSLSMLTGTGISVNVFSEDMETLHDTARRLAAQMETVEGIEEVDNGLKESTEALHINIDRMKAMDHGMTVAQVYMQIAAQLRDSVDASEMELDDQTVSVVIEGPEEDQMTVEKLPELELTPTTMTGEAGESFPLSEIAEVESTLSMNSISRDNQRRCITVTGTVSDDYNITLVTNEAEKVLSQVELPEGTKITYSGENESIMEAVEQLLLMMALGVVLVYFIMVAQFQSLISPFIVMFTIPLAFTGGFLALLISGMELSVVSMIGFVMLVGIIVNNGIVLVDYINQLRTNGVERQEAIIEAGVTRMRPILMTSLTTILGLIVMALEKNVGTSFVQPVAMVCIGGLLYATLMTLFVVPCMYDITNRRELRKVEEEELVTLDW